MSRSPLAVLVASFLLVLGLTMTVPATAGISEQMPSFVVKAAGPSSTQAAALAKSLDLLGNPRNAFGGLVYMSPNYGDLPMRQVTTGGDADEGGRKVTRRAFDLSAIQKLQVPTSAALMSDVRQAFEASKLDPASFLFADGSVRPAVGHTTFTFQAAPPSRRGSPPVIPIDTQVNYRMTLNAGSEAVPRQVPLVGPGAQVKVVQNSKGQVTELQYELRRLARGPMVPIISQQDGLAACEAALQQTKAGAAAVSAKLVYYAPALEPTPTMRFPGSIRSILPWYECDGSVLVGDETVGLRTVFIPASIPGPHANASLQMLKPDQARAAATVNGGAQPYSFSWSSSTGSIDPKTAVSGSLIDYSIVSKEQEPPSSETACVLVTDANGMTSTDCATAQLELRAPPAAASASSSRQIPRLDFGTEYIGMSAHLVGLQDLSGSAPNANGFVNRMSGSATSQFLWADTNAWERDFKQTGFGNGQDAAYADDVDIAFYTGHASETGFAFSNTTHDDGTMSDTEARWGDRDLEWMTIAACLILNRANVGGDWAARWGDSFQGLHFILSYATVSNDNTIEGDHFADYMTRTPFLWWNNPMKVRDAWVQTAIDSQPSSVTWAYMGPLGRNGLTDNEDFFWGKGATGPDIRGADLTGWYQVQGPS